MFGAFTLALADEPSSSPRIGVLGHSTPSSLPTANIGGIDALRSPDDAQPLDLIYIADPVAFGALDASSLQAIRDLLSNGIPVVFSGSEQQFANTLGIPCVDSTAPEPGELFAIRRAGTGRVERAHFFAALYSAVDSITTDQASYEDYLQPRMTLLPPQDTRIASEAAIAWALAPHAANAPTTLAIDDQGAWNAISTSEWVWTGTHDGQTVIQVTLTANAFKIGDIYSDRDWYLLDTRLAHHFEVPYQQCGICEFPSFRSCKTGFYVENRSTSISLDESSSYNRLEDYGPTGTINSSTQGSNIAIGFDITPRGPSGGITAGWSHTDSKLDITITDSSSFPDSLASWREAFICPEGDYAGCISWAGWGQVWPSNNSKNSYYSHKAAIYRTTNLSQGVRLEVIPRVRAYLDVIDCGALSCSLIRETPAEQLGGTRTITLRDNSRPAAPGKPSGPTPGPAHIKLLVP